MKRLKLNLSQLRLLAIPLFLGAGIATATAADELVYASGDLTDTNNLNKGWIFDRYNENEGWCVRSTILAPSGDAFGTTYSNKGVWAITPSIELEEGETYYIDTKICVDFQSVSGSFAANTDLYIVLLNSTTPSAPVTGSGLNFFEGTPPAKASFTTLANTNKVTVASDGTYYIGVYTNATRDGAGVGMDYINLYKVDAGAAPVYPTSITLDKTSVSLKTNKTADLAATVLPDGVNTDKTVSWTTSDDAVATVDANGVVTAVGAGTANISASVKGKDDTIITTETPCKVTVTNYVGTVGMGTPYQAIINGQQFDYWNWGSWTDAGYYGAQINTNGIGDNGWMISHPITFEQGDAYTIKLQCIKSGSDCTFAIYYGNAANNLTNKVGDITATATEYGDAYSSVVLTINTPGTYYIGIKATASSGYLYLKNLSITNTTVKTADGYKFTNKEAVAAGAYNDPDAKLFNLTEIFYDADLPTAANTNAITVIHQNDKATGSNIVKQNVDVWRTDGINLTDGGGNFYYGHDITGPAHFSRTLSLGGGTPKYVTCVLPFAINNTGNICKLDAFGKDTEEHDIINFTKVGESTIPAYTPFVYYAKSDDMAFSGADIVACDGYDDKDLVVKSIDGSGWSYAVTFKQTTIENVTEYTEFDGKDVYYFNNGTFYKATGKLVTNPFRVLFLCTKDSKPDKLKLYIDDDVPTGLEELYRLQDEIENGPAYNEAGIRVDDSYKGIKIRNGKKVIENK